MGSEARPKRAGEGGVDHADRADRARRPLGVWTLLALGINGIVGVGIFFTPNLVAGLLPGRASVLAYLLTLLALLPVAACYAKLGARFDRDGGPYVWACAAFGERAGFVVGFAAYASAVLSSAAVIAGLAEYIAPAFGLDQEKRLFALLAAALIGGVVALGLKPSAWVWSSLTILKLAPLLLLVSAFVVARHGVASVAATAGRSSLDWGRAVLVLVFPMQGFEIVPVPGSHVRSPERAIPIATLGSLVVCAGLYALLQWACVQHVPDLAHAETPLAALAHALGGPPLAKLVSVGTDISAVGIAFGMLAMTPRYLAALAAPGGRATRGFFEQETRNQVPRRALFATLVLIMMLLSVGALGRLLVLSSVAVLFQYSVSVLCLAVLAFKRRHGLTRRGGWAAPFALLALGVMARAVERAESLVMAGILAVALVLSFAQARLGR